MARTKMTPEAKADKKRLEDIERVEQVKLAHLKNLRERFYPKNPTCFFEVGEEIIYGGHSNTKIVEVLDGGCIYKVSCGLHGSNEQYVNWTSIEKKLENQPSETFRQKDDIFITYMSQDIHSLFSKYYFFGVDESPIYQRGYVWNLEDKQNLIDSMFKNVDIGKFLFRHLGYERKEKNMLEVVDGKQRARAILDFFEGRFQYKGKYFKDLSYIDRNHILNFGISVAEVRNITDEQIIKLFIKLNTSGKVMDKEHLKEVEKLLNK